MFHDKSFCSYFYVKAPGLSDRKFSCIEFIQRHLRSLNRGSFLVKDDTKNFCHGKLVRLICFPFQLWFLFSNVMGTFLCAETSVHPQESLRLGTRVAQLTILSFNDVYGICPDAEGRGGTAGVSTLLQRERKKTEHHITVVNGDFLFPSLFSTLDKGKHRIEMMDALGVDLVVLGNHEFDFGPEVLRERMSESKFCWLAANAFDTDCQYFTGPKQTEIIDVDGIKVGFFGLITVEAPLISSTNRKVCFTPVALTAKQMVDQLKAQGADIVVALTHLLMEEDRQLAIEVPGIDVILGGHDDELFTWYNGKTFVHKTGKNAHFLSKVNLVIEQDLETASVNVFPSWEMIANHRIPQDAGILARIQGYEALFDAQIEDPIAIVAGSLDSSTDKVRSQESTMGNLVADALRLSCNADLAIINGGILRGDRVYELGSVLTLRDILSELPFCNMCYMVEIAGEEILEALENGLLSLHGGSGRFPHISGIRYVFDPGQAPGKRVVSVEVQGVALDRKAFYRVATVDYMYHGGDGYNSFKKGKLLMGPVPHIELVASVVEHCRKLQKIDVPIEGRIVCIESHKTLDQVFLQQSGVGLH